MSSLYSLLHVSIEFADCYIIHVDTLMQLLSPFRRLRRLSFLQHPRPLVPEQLIPHCTNTNITHLTVEVDYDAGSEQVTYPPPPQPSSSSSMTSQSDTSNNNIIYLRWQDYRLKYYLFEDMVMPTLRHCPNLLYLSTSSAIIRRRVALVDILELCPKLRMFETTSWWEGYKDDICSALSSVTGDDDDGDDSSGGGRHPLRYLSLEGSFDDDGNHDDPQSQSAFSKCIEERCQALQYVMLASASTFALRALTQLERLAALHLRLPISWENNATPNDLVHLFTKLASNTKLQVLNLEAAQLTTRPVLNAVAGLKSLQFLNIQPAPDIQESDLITFVSSLTHLEALTLHSVANVSKNLFNAIANLGQLASLTLDDCDRVDVEGTRILVDRKARMKDRKQFVLHTMYSRFSEDDGIEDYAKNTPGILFISS